MLSLDANVQLHLSKAGSLFSPWIYVGMGGVLEDFSDVYASVPMGLGLDIRLSEKLHFSSRAEYRLAFDDLRNDILWASGLKLQFGSAKNSKKKKPQPEEPEPKDTDGDGVPDAEDRCPEEAGPPETRGCPDADGDGVADKDDECPDQPGTRATKGCPDRDGDGIADKDDECPDEPGTRANKGCPDRDGDGVPDKDDRCPDTAGPASNNGCPEIEKKDKSILDLAVKNVQFETGLAVLLAESFDILDKVAGLMLKYPDYKIRISGHTDSIGEEPFNQRLSEARARTCADYLIARGTPTERITHQGFGESRPIADNRYQPGRDKNRRVEFELYLE
jgi:outer membrane protein OmpA-like peptidoglycan-associated protein